MSGEDTLFPALLAGIEQFRARVEGSEGDYRTRMLALAGQDGVVPTVTVAVLRALADILAWLHGALDDIDAFIVQADAAVSMLETLGAALAGLGQALDQEWPPELGAAGQVAGSLSQVGGVLAGISDVELPSIIPAPATLLAIQAELGALVGAPADTESGSLDALITALTTQPTEAPESNP